MPRHTPGRRWLSAAVPPEIADAFRARAAAAERTPPAHLRWLITLEVSGAPAITPRLREDVAGQGHHETT